MNLQRIRALLCVSSSVEGRQPQMLRYAEDEVSAFIEEADRKAFNKVTTRLDAQFIAKF